MGLFITVKMDASVVCGFTIFTVILVTLQTSAQVISPPINVTVKRGSWVTFHCGISSSTDVMWQRYSPGMEVLYVSTTKPQNLAPKYLVENSSSLVVKDTDLSDGVTYACIAYNQEQRPHYANLVVIDNLEARVDPSNMASVGDNVNMTCSLSYGGPSHDNPVYPISPDQDPRISIFFGSEDLTRLASEVHVPGTATQPTHRKSLFINRTLTQEDVKKQLRCNVHSVKPTYEDSINISLPFRYSPRTITIEVGANVTDDMRLYSGTLLNCSADGIPAPRVTWMPVRKNPSFEILKAEPGYSVLKLLGAGFHDWNCTASNDPGISAQAYREFNVTVIDLPSKAVGSKTGSVGLGVGLGIGLGIPILLGVIILIIFLRKRKSSGQEKLNAGQKKSLFGKKANSSGVEKPSIIYKPQATNGAGFQALPTNPDGNVQNPNRSYERTSDVSQKRFSDSPGHADLGIKSLGASGSMPRLNESFDSMDERNFVPDPRPRHHASHDDVQFYPSRYQKVTTGGQNSDSTV